MNDARPDRPTPATSAGILPAFVVASAISLAGTRLAGIAMPWYVLTTTGSATLTGVVAFAELAPYVVAKALIGPCIDRFGPVRLSILGALLSMVAVALVPAMQHAGLLSYPVLVGFAVLIGIVRAPGDGAKPTLIPVVSLASGHSLERVGGAFGAIDRLASTVGALTGGLVTAAIGGTGALWITSAAFGVEAILVAALLAPRLRAVDLHDEPGPDAPTGYLAQLAEGWHHLRGDRIILAVVGVLAGTNMLEQAYVVALVPVWALQTGGGPSAIGVLFAAASIASIAGSLVAASVGERLSRRRVYVIAYLLIGLPRFAVLALGAPMWVTLSVLALGGFAGGFINPVIGAVIVERIPGRLMGRVNTLALAIAWALLPFGGLLGGALIGAVGLTTALWIIGVAYVLVTMSPTLMRAWAGIDRPAQQQSASALVPLVDGPPPPPNRRPWHRRRRRAASIGAPTAIR